MSQLIRKQAIILLTVGVILCFGLNSRSQQSPSPQRTPSSGPFSFSNALQIVDILSKIENINVASQKLEKSGKALTPTDAQILDEAIQGPQGLNRIGIYCTEDPECQQCYANRQGTPDIRGDLQRIFRNLIKARAIYLATEDFVKNAIAFGDAWAGLPGAGLGWPTQRQKILESFNKFKVKYNRKIEEFIGDLEPVLKAIALCEATRLGQTQTWWDTTGIMYIDFLRMYYRAR